MKSIATNVLTSIAFSFFSVPHAFGMPGPYLASADDLMAIIYEPTVKNSFGDFAISSIVRKAEGEYVVVAGQCLLTVTVERFIDPAEPIPMVPKHRVNLKSLECESQLTVK